MIDGEAGIGNTILWAAAADRARAFGVRRILVAASVEAGAKLAYAVLGDLAAGVLDVVLPELPRPQRRALEVALRLEEDRSAAADERSVAAAFLSCLRVLATAGGCCRRSMTCDGATPRPPAPSPSRCAG